MADGGRRTLRARQVSGAKPERPWLARYVAHCRAHLWASQHTVIVRVSNMEEEKERMELAVHESKGEDSDGGEKRKKVTS